ncbi:hypothetical protein [Lacinutrix sp.]|uniref:hypothetical protein n=1 Tax=Lacinutrix sp. TaxID=1937692 RepID=UPI0025C2F0DB|nr:hypothetical protein [Lacinutrix sp.]
MILNIKRILILSIILVSCQTGKLEVIANIDNKLDEVSANEIIPQSNLIWVIEDSNNKNNIYGLNAKGNISKNIDVSNAKNIDWEDLTKDKEGNLYIGDFGNNSRKRKIFTIYKINKIATIASSTKADIINFTLPKNVPSEDFEAFFLWDGLFYIFSKNDKKTKVITVPNSIGNHEASFYAEYKLEGKNTPITAADISADGKQIALLNHDKVWLISDFKKPNFFKGNVTALPFMHKSQKEGLCFKDSKTIYISDERKKHDGKIYSFNLD